MLQQRALDPQRGDCAAQLSVMGRRFGSGQRLCWRRDVDRHGYDVRPRFRWQRLG